MTYPVALPIRPFYVRCPGCNQDQRVMTEAALDYIESRGHVYRCLNAHCGIVFSYSPFIQKSEPTQPKEVL